MAWGPLWNSFIAEWVQPCIDYWWSSLLYIQNYLNPNAMVRRTPKKVNFLNSALTPLVPWTILVPICGHPTILRGATTPNTLPKMQKVDVSCSWSADSCFNYQHFCRLLSEAAFCWIIAPGVNIFIVFWCLQFLRDLFLVVQISIHTSTNLAIQDVDHTSLEWLWGTSCTTIEAKNSKFRR